MEYMHAARQKAHIRRHFQICRLRNVNGNQMQTGVIDDMISKDKSHIQVVHQWQVRLMNRLIRVWFLNPSQLPNSQYMQPVVVFSS